MVQLEESREFYRGTMPISYDQKILLSNPDVKQTEDSLYVSDLIKTRNIKYFLEIGTCHGGSLAFYSYSLSSYCTIIGIDDSSVLRSEFVKIIESNCHKFHFIRDSSHSFNSYNKVIEILDGNTIDFLHIDGDHSYEGVSKDFYDYYKLVSINGIIVIHDVGTEKGVRKFWKELESSSFKLEKFKYPGQYPNIGIVYKEK